MTEHEVETLARLMHDEFRSHAKKARPKERLVRPWEKLTDAERENYRAVARAVLRRYSRGRRS